MAEGVAGPSSATATPRSVAAAARRETWGFNSANRDKRLETLALKAYDTELTGFPFNFDEEKARRKRNRIVKYLKAEHGSQAPQEAIKFLLRAYEGIEACFRTLTGKSYLFIAIKIALEFGIMNNLLGELIDRLYAATGGFYNPYPIRPTYTPVRNYALTYLDNTTNFEALEKLLSYCTTNRKLFLLRMRRGVARLRFQDVPTKMQNSQPMLHAALASKEQTVIKILLRYGAKMLTRKKLPMQVTSWANIPYLKMAFPQVFAVPWLLAGWDEFQYSKSLLSKDRNKVYVSIRHEYSPGTVSPATLKHLAGCAIRKELLKSWNLPEGIYALPLPNSLKEYLDLRIQFKLFEERQAMRQTQS